MWLTLRLPFVLPCTLLLLYLAGRPRTKVDSTKSTTTNVEGIQRKNNKAAIELNAVTLSSFSVSKPPSFLIEGSLMTQVASKMSWKTHSSTPSIKTQRILHRRKLERTMLFSLQTATIFSHKHTVVKWRYYGVSDRSMRSCTKKVRQCHVQETYAASAIYLLLIESTILCDRFKTIKDTSTK